MPNLHFVLRGWAVQIGWSIVLWASCPGTTAAADRPERSTTAQPRSVHTAAVKPSHHGESPAHTNVTWAGFSEPVSEPPVDDALPEFVVGANPAFTDELDEASGSIEQVDAMLPPSPSLTVAELLSEENAPAAESSETAKLKKRLDALEKKLGKQDDDAKKKKLADSLKATAKLTGQVQTDFAWFGQTTENRQQVGDIQDGADFRRARIGVIGDFEERVEYRLEWDFALTGRPAFLDNWIMVKGVPVLGDVKVGHYFEPFLLERVTPNRFLTFMERSLPDAFAPARNTGIESNHVMPDELGTYRIGVFRTDSDVFGDDVGDTGEWAVTARMTRLLMYEEEGKELLHIGIAHSHRQADQRTARFSSRPEIRMFALNEGEVPNFVDTGNMPARSWELMGLEAAMVYHSFSCNSEVVMVPVDRLTGDNLFFWSWYVQASYFLTGEHRPYRKAGGFFDRPIPLTNAFKGPMATGAPKGPGAWEVALRYGRIDLQDDNINGGTLDEITVGLNWYLNPYTKVQWNYLHSMLDRTPTNASRADIVGMRFHFEF
jgi:phosphate-selective porin OprO and OprP